MKTALITLMGLTLILAACSESDNEMITISETEIDTKEDTPAAVLTDAEITALLLMREEEKLARDTYDYLYMKWASKAFDNISSSEQTHMDAVLALLNSYEIDDPATADIPGYFVNEELQNLYNDLIKIGSNSLVEAFKVGAAIEEIDILDLRREMETNIEQVAIKVVFESLEKGSENHLRSFVKNLLSNGVSYTPQYMTQDLYDEIIEKTGN